jgi:predicted RNA binding protein YcfA (HicA-like mRNA interferase family)
MSEKLPSVSGKVLISFLESLGYVRLLKVTPAGKHKLTIPDHNPVAKGTLADILGKVSIWCQMDKQEIITRLRSW